MCNHNHDTFTSDCPDCLDKLGLDDFCACCKMACVELDRELSEIVGEPVCVDCAQAIVDPMWIPA